MEEQGTDHVFLPEFRFGESQIFQFNAELESRQDRVRG